MTVEWKDTTSFCQGDTERKPTTYRAKSGNLEITITCGHIHYRPDWVMHCHQLGISTEHLKAAKTMIDAQHMAMAVVQIKAAKIKDDADGFYSHSID